MTQTDEYFDDPAPSRWSELFSRIQAADGPSRELDAAIWLACFEPACQSFAVQFEEEHYDNHLTRYGLTCDLGSMWIDQMDPPLRAFTASVDCTVELIERALPGMLYGVRHGSNWAPHHKWAGKPVWEALIGDPGDSDSYLPWGDADAYDDYDDIEEHMADHCSPAMALCEALCRALRAAQSAGTKQPVGDA